MSATLIRKILLKMPRPHTLRLKVADEVQMMTIPPSPHWAEIAETIDNLDPELIEVLDSKGGLLRSAKSDQFDDQLVEDKQVASRASFAEKGWLSGPPGRSRHRHEFPAVAQECRNSVYVRGKSENLWKNETERRPNEGAAKEKAPPDQGATRGLNGSFFTTERSGARSFTASQAPGG
jgi:hypothetical protein